MTNKLKVGDYIKSKEQFQSKDGTIYLTKDKEYQILEIDYKEGSPYFKITDDSGEEYFFNNWRFNINVNDLPMKKITDLKVRTGVEVINGFKEGDYVIAKKIFFFDQKYLTYNNKYEITSVARCLPPYENKCYIGVINDLRELYNFPEEFFKLIKN